MRRKMFRNAAIGVLAAWPAMAMATPQYKVVDLGPMGIPYYGGTAAGIANGQEVGYALWGSGTAAPVDHAVFWDGSANSMVDLQPASGWYATRAMGTNGSWQIGAGLLSDILGPQAVMWQGSADSIVNLTPAGASSAEATGISGNQIAGYAYFPISDGTAAYAVVWNGPNHTAVNLGPGGLYGTDGINQVGQSTGGAALWSGTAESLMRLGQGSGYTQSIATAVAGNQEVGYGLNSQSSWRALLWHGSADSVVDLTPAGATEAQAFGTNGTYQVGEANAGAALWMGSAESYIDLNSFLPPEFTGSAASGIDPDGDIIGFADYSPTENNHAVMWIPIPEPSIILLASGLIGILSLSQRIRMDI